MPLATQAETGSITDRLRCPRCKAELRPGAGIVTCTVCGSGYEVAAGTIPVYGLFVDDHSDEAGRDPGQMWNRARFEEGYQNTGYHESGEEFDRALGYPPEVSRFLFERVKRRLLEWVRPGPDHRILDVGCGAGYFLALIRRKYIEAGFEPKIAGAEISVAQLSYMAQRMSREGVRDAVAVHASGEYLPFESETFDLVTCSEVLEHIRNPGRALAEMRRVLKPDGLLLLSTPSMTAQKGWGVVLAPLIFAVKAARGFQGDPSGRDGGYDIPWYPKEFRETVDAAGLTIQEFQRNAVIPLPWYFRSLARPLVKPTVAGFGFVDRHLKWMFQPLALHFVVRATRRKS